MDGQLYVEYGINLASILHRLPRGSKMRDMFQVFVEDLRYEWETYLIRGE